MLKLAISTLCFLLTTTYIESTLNKVSAMESKESTHPTDSLKMESSKKNTHKSFFSRPNRSATSNPRARLNHEDDNSSLNKERHSTGKATKLNSAP